MFDRALGTGGGSDGEHALLAPSDLVPSVVRRKAAFAKADAGASGATRRRVTFRHKRSRFQIQRAPKPSAVNASKAVRLPYNRHGHHIERSEAVHSGDATQLAPVLSSSPDRQTTEVACRSWQAKNETQQTQYRASREQPTPRLHPSEPCLDHHTRWVAPDFEHSGAASSQHRCLPVAPAWASRRLEALR